MCVHTYAHECVHVYAHECKDFCGGQERVLDLPGAGVMSYCETPDICAGNQTLVL